MVRQVIRMLCHAAALLAATTSLALGHHAMDYAMPATPLQGLLSGFGHPIIGVDHLLFILGAGVVAARWKRGWILPMVFVIASLTAATGQSLAIARGLGLDPQLFLDAIDGTASDSPYAPAKGAAMKVPGTVSTLPLYCSTAPL